VFLGSWRSFFCSIPLSLFFKFCSPTTRPLAHCGSHAERLFTFHLMTVLWPRRLVAGLSLWRTGFDRTSFPVRFNVALGQFYPCHYHSANASHSSSSTCCSFGNGGELAGNVLLSFQHRAVCPFILLSVLRQVHSPFESEFFTKAI
jgi:hypothetical protein